MTKKTPEAKRQAIFQLNVNDATRALLATANGRDFLWWILGLGAVGTQPFTTNALTTAFNCGEMNVGQQVLARIIEVDPAGYVRMQQEKAEQHGRPSGDNADDRTDPGNGSGDNDAPGNGGFDLAYPEREPDSVGRPGDGEN